jgi:hypothetical protein
VWFENILLHVKALQVFAFLNWNLRSAGCWIVMLCIFVHRENLSLLLGAGSNEPNEDTDDGELGFGLDSNVSPGPAVAGNGKVPEMVDVASAIAAKLNVQAAMATNSHVAA